MDAATLKIKPVEASKTKIDKSVIVCAERGEEVSREEFDAVTVALCKLAIRLPELFDNEHYQLVRDFLYRHHSVLPF